MSWKIGGKFYRRTDIKMTLWYVLTFLVSALLICTFLYLRLGHQLIKEIDQFLLDETKEMERVLSRESKETYFLMRFEDEVMARKYYPFFFQILDKEGKPVYVSKEFQEMGYVTKNQMLINARNGKETRERIHSPRRRTPYRIISTPVYKNGKLTEIIQLEIAHKYSFHYLSCTRAKEPFIHEISGLMEIPSDLPCFEEMGVTQGVSRILQILKDGGMHILPVHAEVEGGIWDKYFIELCEKVQSMDFQILPLSKIRALLETETLPVRKYRMVLLPGRSSPCAV